MPGEPRSWGFGPASVEGRLLRGAIVAVLLVLYVSGFLHSHNWTVLVLPGVLLVSTLVSRSPHRVEIDGDIVSFVLPVRTVRMSATDIHRLRRTRLVGNVVVETAAGKFKLPFWLKGLQEMALHMWALNPSLVIDGP